MNAQLITENSIQTLDKNSENILKTKYDINCLKMKSRNILILLSLYLHFHSSIDCLSLNRLLNANQNESNDCPTLCDRDIHIDAITPINVRPELLLISGDCAFVVDPRLPGTNQIRHGFKPSFAFSEIQDIFAIGNNTDIEFVSVYVSLRCLLSPFLHLFSILIFE